MAFPLSSPVVSRRFSLSSPLHITKHTFLHSNSIFRFTHSSRTSVLPKLSSNSHNHSSLGLEDQHNFLQQLCISPFELGKREIRKLIAVLLICIQISSPLPLLNWDFQSIHPAMAVLYSPDTKVPRTGELALRRAIPANTSMKAIQDSLEEISYLLRIPQRKPYGTMEGNVKKALKLAVDEKDLILGSIPSESKEKGLAIYTTLIEGKVHKSIAPFDLGTWCTSSIAILIEIKEEDNKPLIYEVWLKHI